MTADLQGRIAVITGANSGIGLEACVQLAERGCEVVMCCRSVEKAEEAKKSIVERSKVEASKVSIVQLDLADLDNIETFRTRYDAIPSLASRPVDMLILNAGIMAPPQRMSTKQGLEMQLGTNVVGHFKFAACMIDLCKRAPTSRIVFVSSLTHKWARWVNTNDFVREQNYKKWSAYCESKLSDLLMAFKLNRLFEEKGIKNMLAVGCHPGYSATNLQSHLFAYKIANYFFAQDPSAGAQATVLAATDPDAKRDGYCGPHGFLDMRGPAQWGSYVNPVAFDAKLQDKVWEKCEEITKCDFAGKL